MMQPATNQDITAVRLVLEDTAEVVPVMGQVEGALVGLTIATICFQLSGCLFMEWKLYVTFFQPFRRLDKALRPTRQLSLRTRPC
jgi:hypothetical protein